MNLERLKEHLSGKMTGPVSSPGELGYEKSVAIWAKPNVLPRLVAHCESVADVQVAVRSAHEAGMPLSVRGGGHDWTGRALCEGLTLDVTRMNAVSLIPSAGTVEVGGGAKATDVFAVTDPAGVVPVLGSVADIGAAGLVTGGGYGPLLRRFGLACDNLRAATLVLADGRTVLATEDDEEELFWAIRGGGGNFGVVTSMELVVRPLASVRSGILLFPFERGDDVLPRLEEIWADAPIELDVQTGIVPGPDGTPVVYISPTWSGDPSGCEAALAPLYAIEHRFMANLREQPFGVSRTFFDAHIVKGRVTAAETLWLRGWSVETSRIVMQAMRRRPSPLCFVLCHEFSGAAARVPASSTPFGLRRPHVWFEVIAPAEPTSGSDGSREAEWARQLAQDLAPHAFPGGYPNMLGRRHERIGRSFGDNASRLAAAKRRYDPDNVFRSAISIPDVDGAVVGAGDQSLA